MGKQGKSANGILVEGSSYFVMLFAFAKHRTGEERLPRLFLASVLATFAHMRSGPRDGRSSVDHLQVYLNELAAGFNPRLHSIRNHERHPSSLRRGGE